MTLPPIPENESLRLRTLNSLNLMNTTENDRFDRLTRLAKKMFHVPIAMVTLLDADRQLMKSCIGMQPIHLPRTASFCSHAIIDSEIFVVPNMLEDERFIENRLVVEHGVRFYAGYPIKASNGSILGALCVLDTKPREFTDDDHESLSDLGAMVELEIAAIELAVHDNLTGLLNRRGFELLADNNLKQCERNETSACVAFLDLNKFKSINDDFGHKEGDRALMTFADILKSNVRKTDVVARLGGDEFTILFMDTGIDHAKNLCVKLKDELGKQPSDSSYQLSTAIGLVEFNAKKHSSIQDVLSESDQLMYEDKK